MFWRRSKYRLPKFPATVAQTFRFLCEEISDEELATLSVAVDARLQEVLERSTEDSHIDVENFRKLAKVCHELLERYNEFPASKKKLIVGAIRYFAVAEDPFDDQVFASGLYDDMRIMNHVLEQLGIHDRYLHYNYST